MYPINNARGPPRSGCARQFCRREDRAEPVGQEPVQCHVFLPHEAGGRQLPERQHVEHRAGTARGGDLDRTAQAASQHLAVDPACMGLLRHAAVAPAADGCAEPALVCAHILITLEPRKSSTIECGLRRIQEPRTLHSVSGPFDLIAIVVASSIGELDGLIDRIGALDGVERTTSATVLSTRIQR